MSPDTLAALNVVEQDHSVVGVAITRFANFIRGQTPDLTARCHTENPVESLLLCLEILPTLSRHLHYRPFFARMLQTGTRSSLADLCIALLAGRNDLQFSRILNGDAVLDSRRELREPKEGAPQNVLLIGHAGEGTGLSRNLRMLTAGLTGDDIALTTMFYESDPERFGEDLKRWRENCRSEPIVVAAVNAHDIPTLFIRDRHGVLDTCRVAGFFLWETSRAPRVQHLGVALVDEVWAPTRYVAEVYASLAKTFVVGKGLFAPDSAARARPRPPGPLRFLTVFDFHSSIERKNPLASALAFRKAFPGGEDVELIVKASNVNPQHPGNAYGQWERLCAEAAQDSRIRIITERYSEEQMNALIADVGCVVSLHRSEGFGYVLSDAMAVGIPVIATAHSGNLDFCDADTSFLVDCRLVPVSALGAHWESNEAMWAEPDIDSAAAQMRRVCADYPAALSVAAAGQRVILAKYTTTVFAANLRARLAAIRGSGRGVDASSEAVH
jgi:glycosyltransferase involved in cell wall biosynthesis